MHKLIWLVMLALLASACTNPVKPPQRVENSALRSALSALQAGRYQEASRRFRGLANDRTITSAERLDYQLYAAEALLRDGDIPATERMMLDLTLKEASPTQKMRHQLLRAEIALTNDPARALNLLTNPLANSSERGLFSRYHQLRSEAYRLQENYLAAAQERVFAEQYLSDEQQIILNQEAIWGALSHFSSEELAMLAIEPPPNTLTGWLELIAIMKRLKRPGEEMSAALLEWRNRFPRHGVRQAVVDSMLTQGSQLPENPRHVALLLPLSGRYGRASSAVRDGFLAAYYHSPELGKIRLDFYDTGLPGSDVKALYSEAVEAGAEMVIGPLQKEEVQQLAGIELSVPTLALNYLDEPNDNPQLYQYGLSPEAEAEQIADYAASQGLTRAAMIAPAGSWGERMAEAFRSRWKSHNGVVVGQTIYDPQQSDLSAPLKQMLHLNQSEARKSRLQSQLRVELEFEPRRRQDIDFIYLATFPRQGRQIRPLLRFHRAGRIPIFATSHIFSGVRNPGQDRDLDGIRFIDIPWVLDSDTPQLPVRTATRQLLPQYSGKLQRLLAMGLDAYHLTFNLGALKESPEAEYRGETGRLTLIAHNRIQTLREWAEFNQGQPSLLQLQPLQAPLMDEIIEPPETEPSTAAQQP